MADAGVPTSGNRISPQALAVRRLILLDRAREALGSAQAVADVLGISRRAVNYKLTADREVTGRELTLAAEAIAARGAELSQLAADLRGVVR